MGIGRYNVLFSFLIPYIPQKTNSDYDVSECQAISLKERILLTFTFTITGTKHVLINIPNILI